MNDSPDSPESTPGNFSSREWLERIARRDESTHSSPPPVEEDDITPPTVEHPSRSRLTSLLSFLDVPSGGGEDSSASRRALVGPLLVVAIACVFGLFTLRTEAMPVAYPNDSSVHLETITFALHAIRAGHLPFSGWFPNLSLGSPFLMHYQSAPAVLGALLGLVFGAPYALSITLYVLLALWPISIYFAARLLSWGRWAAAGAAAVAPFLVSVRGYGFEHESYVWLGSGLWPQLWAMWALPLAFGFTYQAISKGRHRFAAMLTVALTIAFHFLTAYLLGLTVILWVIIRPTQILLRVRRAAVFSVGALLATLWVTVPLVVFAKWSAANEFIPHTFWDDSYGARAVLHWLITGQIYDAGRFPIITVLVGVGLVICLVRFRSDERCRALLLVWLMSLVLFCGRDPFAFIIDLLPGNSNLLLHRYIMGVHLAGIFLAGLAVEWIFLILIRVLRALKPALYETVCANRRLAPVLVLASIAALVALLQPAWSNLASYDDASAQGIQYQKSLDSTEGAAVDKLVAISQRLGGGRIYAGLPSNWGHSFVVGDVPVYIYLTDIDVDEVGFTLRTYSLMNDPEVYFDEFNPGDYSIFGIHYLLLPSGHLPPVSARLIKQIDNYELWSVGSPGYVQVVDTTGTITANATNLGSQTAYFLSSTLPGKSIYPSVAFAGQPAAPATIPRGTTETGPAGTVTSEYDDLSDGKVSATVVANRTSVVLLKVSFDPGWSATVDGQPVSPEMIAPALVGVTVAPGAHTITFAYHGYGLYPLLFAISFVSVLGFAFGPALRRRYLGRKKERALS